MADRYIAFTVTLEKEMCRDEMESIMNAIRMVRGVADAVPVVMNAHDHWAKTIARQEIVSSLVELLKPLKQG